MQFKTEPLDYQLEDFERFKDEKAFGLLWEMGMGKSKTLVDIACYKYKMDQIDQILILAPTGVHEQWTSQQFPEHGIYELFYHNYRNESTQKYARELAHFLSRRFDNSDKIPALTSHLKSLNTKKFQLLLEEYLEDFETLVIVDESSMIKNDEAALVKQLKKICRKHSTQRAFLTGTAMAKRPTDIYSQADFAIKNFFQESFASFKSRYCVQTTVPVTITVGGGRTKDIHKDVTLTEKMYNIIRQQWNKNTLFATKEDENRILQEMALKFNMRVADVAEIVGMTAFTKWKNLPDLYARTVPLVSQRRKKDHLQLPEKQYSILQFPLNTEQKRLIKELQKTAVAMYGEHELTVQVKATLGMRVLQICGGFFPSENITFDTEKYTAVPIEGPNHKLEYILHDMDEICDTQFIIWACFTAELEMLYAELNKKAPMALLYGPTPQEERFKIVERFQRGEIQGIVANPTIGGYGLNLQAASLQYWYSRSYRTEARLQAEDRSHRLGTKTPPLYKDLLCAGVHFEEKVLNDNRDGRDLNDFFMSRSVTDILNVDF